MLLRAFRARFYVRCVQSTHKIAGCAAAGFAAYLTTSASRGDYYVGGELEGEGGALARVARGARRARPRPVTAGPPVGAGGVDGGSLAGDGEPIRRVGGDGSRVAGIDATFSAPKSVSALWAVSGPYRRAQIEVAHRRAVASALGRIERDVELVRRRERGELRWETARSLVAAEFVHTSSRLTRDQERDGVPGSAAALARRDPRGASARTAGSRRSTRESCFVRSARTARGTGRSSRTSCAGSASRSAARTGRDGRFFELAGCAGGVVEALVAAQ